jgi:hypothetical protein
MGNQQQAQMMMMSPQGRQMLQRPMMQAPQKPKFATVPDAINVAPFDSSKYAANIQQPMQRAYELQKNVADQRESERQKVMAENTQKQQQYDEAQKAYNQQMMQSKYQQGRGIPYPTPINSQNANNQS